MPINILGKSIELQEVNTMLGEYFRDQKKTIIDSLEKEEDWRPFCTEEVGVKDQRIGTVIKHKGDVMQPYQTKFTPKGGVKFVPEINQVRACKIDVEITPQEIERTALAWLKTDGSQYTKTPFVGKVLDKILQRLRYDINNVVVNGNYQGPPPDGVAGDTLASFDGWVKIYNNAVAAGKIVPYALGAITKDNVVDKLEEMFDVVPLNKRLPGLQMFVDQRTLLKYHRRRRGTEFQNAIVMNTTLDGTVCQLVAPLNWPEGRIMMAHKENMLYMEDGINEEMNMTFQWNGRVINCMVDFKRGVGFETIEGEVFGNLVA